MKNNVMKKTLTSLAISVLVLAIVLSAIVTNRNLQDVDQTVETNGQNVETVVQPVDQNEHKTEELLEEKNETEIITVPDNNETINVSTEVKHDIKDENSQENIRIINEEGNLTVPYDQVDPEAFANGDLDYDEHTLAIKIRNGINAEELLKDSGIDKLDELFTVSSGTWYEGFIFEGKDITEVIETVRLIDGVINAEYNFIWEISDNGLESLNLENNERYGSQTYLDQMGIKNAWQYQISNNMPVAGAGTVVAVIDTGVDYNHSDLINNMWINQGEIPDNGVDDDGNGYVDDYYGIDIVKQSGSGLDDNGHGTHVAGIIGAVNNTIGTVGVAFNSKIMAIKAADSSGQFTQTRIANAIIYAHNNGADVINMSFGGATIDQIVLDALEFAYTDSVLVAAAGNDSKIDEEIEEHIGTVSPSYPACLPYVLGVMSINNSGTESLFTNFDGEESTYYEYEVYASGEQIVSTIPNNKYAAWSGTSMAAPVISGMAAMVRADFNDREMYPTKYIYGQIVSTGENYALCCKPNMTGHGEMHNIPLIADAYKALSSHPTPNVTLYDYAVFDSVELGEKNNGDGVIDAGEVISLGFELMNRWGLAKDTTVTINSISEGGVYNPYVQFATKDNETYENSASINYGAIGTYSTGSAGKVMDDDMWIGWDNPFLVKIADDCPNDTSIIINIEIEERNGLDENDTNVYSLKKPQSITLSIRNGVILPTVIRENQTWTSDNYYILSNSIYIMEGVTVDVEPGTKIQFWSNDPEDPYASTSIVAINAEGTINFNGSKDAHIEIFPSQLMSNYRVEIYGHANFNYCDIKNPYFTYSSSGKEVDSIKNCNFTSLSLLRYRYLGSSGIQDSDCSPAINCKTTVENSTFYKIGGKKNYGTLGLYGSYKNCAFIDSKIDMSGEYINCLFYGNNSDINYGLSGFGGPANLQPKEVSVSKMVVEQVYTDENTGTTYAVLRFRRVNATTDSKEIDSVLAYMGGHVACWETQEERNIIPEHFYSSTGATPIYSSVLYEYVIVDENGNVTGMNGNPIPKYLTGNYYGGEDEPYTVDIPAGKYYRTDGGYNTGMYYTEDLKSVNSGYYYSCQQEGENWVNVMAEIPDDGSGTVWNEELLMAKHHEYVMSGENIHFKNNAIINRLSSSDPENSWLRLQAEYVSSYKEYNITYNYWGTNNETLINRQIIDFDDYRTLANLNPSPWLEEAPDDVWPFVVDAGVLNVEGDRVTTVGNEAVTFFVEFNRPMDTSVALDFRFGSADPYADYAVTDGEWQTPTRWIGNYVINTRIESGTQYMTIANAYTADEEHLKFFDDRARFTFNIDMSSVLSMNLQGEATDTGVNLTWDQDDFDTLIGYNVYRSDKENGLYTKLNSVVIPVGEEEFFDDTVEPGMIYYYTFTVVQSDMAESTPSGRIVVQAKDTMAPDIYHSPVQTAFTGTNLVISATVIDNVEVQWVKLHYRVSGTETWKSVNMTKNNDKYYGTIPSADITTEGIDYYIEAFDGSLSQYKGSEENPFVITVKEAVTNDQLGDVDGDGKITNRDALMILQHVNNLITLTPEQFARANIINDDELSAAEALIILKYVSGKITNIAGN